jgi:pimeloyl-ACP methyl ester carboxylesterase
MRALSISTLWTIPVLLLALPIYFFTQHHAAESDSPAKFGCDLQDFDSLFNYAGVSRDHYSVTSHHLVTADKYHLLMIRVGLTESQRLVLPKKQKKNFNKKVLVLHEFGGSADSAFYNGDRSYGFFLVNQGYDVWMGNNRGNKYSNADYGENSKIDNFYDYR